MQAVQACGAMGDGEVLGELGAHVETAGDTMAALLELLRQSPQGYAMEASRLTVLLAPVADQLAQAQAAARLLQDGGGASRGGCAGCRQG